MNIMTVYDKALLDMVSQRLSTLTATEATERLIELGLIDNNRCKAMIIRDFVDKLVADGESKVEAMYTAAEKFCCSYECIRKYIYYYKN